MTDDAAMRRPAAASVSPEQLLAVFREPRFEPVTVTIADLVTVRMDARYQVVEVALHGPSDESGQVEAALREAFNEAVRQVMERNAARLSTLMAKGLSGEEAAASEP
jgi:hypothetical protein